MADTFWTGKALYNSNAERDVFGKRIEDFLQAKLNVVPHPDSAFTLDPSGVEYRNNLTIGTDSGPGFLWSVKLPAGDPVVGEAETLDAAVQDAAVNGSGGFYTA